MDKSRKEFICAAFPKIKYFDIGLTEPAKFKLRKEDIKIAGIVMTNHLTGGPTVPLLPRVLLLRIA